MPHLRLATLAATIAVFIIAAPVAAGGWATVVPDQGSITGLEPGRPHDVSVTLLQHGSTPVVEGAVTLTLTDATTGTALSVPARHVGDGRWAATVTLPSAGEWSFTTHHDSLDTEMGPPVALTLSSAAAAGGTASVAAPMPAMLAALVGGTLLAILGAAGVVKLTRARPREETAAR